MTAVLFVCLGNICRSPTADGILRHLVAERRLTGITADSAGIGGWHAGDPPDPRAIEAAARRGVDISGLRARRVRAADFDDFDLILGMDWENINDLARLRPPGSRADVGLFLRETLGRDRPVPDPYYGTRADFDAVFDLCLAGVEAWLAARAAQAAKG